MSASKLFFTISIKFTLIQLLNSFLELFFLTKKFLKVYKFLICDFFFYPPLNKLLHLFASSCWYVWIWMGKVCRVCQFKATPRVRSEINTEEKKFFVFLSHWYVLIKHLSCLHFLSLFFSFYSQKRLFFLQQKKKLFLIFFFLSILFASFFLNYA